MANATISIYLDTRRKKDNKLYPVKLRVYHNKETRFYPISLDLSEETFMQSYLSKRPKGPENKELKIKLTSIEVGANEVKENLKLFSFEKFEKQFLRPSGSGSNVFYHYEQVIARLKQENRIGTASSYTLSAKSLRHFLIANNKRSSQLSFDQINVSFLKDYENWMLQNGKSITTVGIYLRALRAIFNEAIAEGEITSEVYPFGKRRYGIPAGRNVKKSFNRETLKVLFEYSVEGNPFWEKARDFWFFSYVCNGMNIKDIAELKYKNLSDDVLHFIRSKTKNTTKSNQKPVIVSLTPFAISIIKKYGNKRANTETFIFPVLNHEMTADAKFKAVQAFTRFINQHMKSLAKQAGIKENISTYWARHSFTTMAVQNGASLEFIQDSLGHANIATTMKYWKGFEINAKKEVANKLMDF